jgi:hypothetical protein
VTWANFDDNFADHPKVLGLSDGAFRLHVSGIVYCSRYLTDGEVPAVQVPRLMPNYQAKYAAELVARDLWDRDGESYHIHDYLQWNRSRAQVTSERARKSEAGKRGAKKRWG